MAQLMSLPLTISCSSKIQIGFTFLVLAHLGNPGQRAVKRVCARPALVTGVKQPLQMNDFATFDIAEFNEISQMATEYCNLTVFLDGGHPPSWIFKI